MSIPVFEEDPLAAVATQPTTTSVHPLVHPADVVSQHLLPAVGVLFALYLVALVVLVLVTSLAKLTVRRGVHRAVRRRHLVTLPDDTLTPSVPGTLS